MTNHKNSNKSFVADSLSPFGDNNDLNLRIAVDSHQESYNSGVNGDQKGLKPFTKSKGSKFKNIKTKNK